MKIISRCSLSGDTDAVDSVLAKVRCLSPADQPSHQCKILAFYLSANQTTDRYILCVGLTDNATVHRRWLTVVALTAPSSQRDLKGPPTAESKGSVSRQSCY